MAFTVATFFGLNREVVTVAMNHLDRYLATILSSKTTSTNTATANITTATTTTTISKQDFQLWVLTSLYLAIKLNHGCCQYQDRLHLPGTNSTLQVICQLSDNPEPFDPQIIQQMELNILQALDWYVHPPTPQSILRQLWNPNMSRQLLRMLRGNNHHVSSEPNVVEHSAQWWYSKVYDHCCDLLDKILQEYEFSLCFSCSELAIATILQVVDSCKFGNIPAIPADDSSSSSNQTPSVLLLSQWKLSLPTEFGTKLRSSSMNACRQQLREYLLQQQQESGMSKKNKRQDNLSCDSEVDLVASPPITTKKARIRVVPSPACIRDIPL